MTRDEKNAELARIIQPIASPKYEVDVPFAYLEEGLASYAQNWGGMDLTPDFQRGHVWRPEQQTAFIESVLRGVVSTAGVLIQWNCANWNDSAYAGELPLGFQCIDGLQRLTAIRRYMGGEIKPFGLSVRDLDDSGFSARRARYQLRFAVFDFGTREQLIHHYLDLNGGGTPHTTEELDRVRALLRRNEDKHEDRFGGRETGG